MSLLFTHCCFMCVFFFFKQKTAYEMRISDWSSDVCSSDLVNAYGPTEITCFSHAAEVADDGNAPPIGRPMANTRSYVLDPNLRPVQIGRASCRERVYQYV